MIQTISYRFRVFSLAVLIVTMISLTTSTGVMTSDLSYQTNDTPVKLVEPAQTTQSLDFTLGSWDSRIPDLPTG